MLKSLSMSARLNWKRVLSMLLVLLTVLGMFPTTAFASDAVLTYEPTGSFDVNVAGATGWSGAGSALPVYDAEAGGTATLSLPAATAVVLLEDNGGGRVKIGITTDASGNVTAWEDGRVTKTGWVDKDKLLVNLPDVLPSITYNRTDVKDQYDAIRLTVLNRTGGPVDTLVLGLRELLGWLPVPGNPNFPSGVAPHIWHIDGKLEWYAARPSQKDYKTIRQAAAQYLNAFRDRTQEQHYDNPKLVYICASALDSPEKNIAFAQQRSSEIMQDGNTPVCCPRLLFPPDTGQDQAAHDLELRLLDFCHQVNVYGAEWTEDMWAEIRRAMERGIPVMTDQRRSSCQIMYLQDSRRQMNRPLLFRTSIQQGRENHMSDESNTIKEVTTEYIRHMEGKEGLVLQGCGGDLQEWVDGINEMLTGAGILLEGSKFENAVSFQHDGSTNLLFPFEDAKLDVGKFAMWRLQTHEQFGGTWLSDYVPNRLGGFVQEQPARRPQMQLEGHDGNIFAILASASMELNKAGQRDQINEMFQRVSECGDYNKALNIISEYVETELSPKTPQKSTQKKGKNAHER